MTPQQLSIYKPPPLAKFWLRPYLAAFVLKSQAKNRLKSLARSYIIVNFEDDHHNNQMLQVRSAN